MQTIFLRLFFSFKIVGQDLFTCGLLIKSNWTLAILLFLFLGLLVFCTLAWVVAGGLHSRLFFCLMSVHQGGQAFLTCWLCSDLQIKALASSSASKAAIFLADTLRCFQPQTLCLPFWTCYTPDPTFPFGAKHSIWHKTFLLCAGLHSYLCLK